MLSNETLNRVVAFSLLLSPAGVAIADPPSEIEVLHGKVVAVSDGDTLRLLVDKTEHRIRLEGIDAPESKQAFGSRAKQALSDLAFGKQASVIVTGRDRYGRVLGVVNVGDIEVNLVMLSRGMAWHYKRYNSDEEYAAAEHAAKSELIGLWEDSAAIPPWEFRANRGKKR